MNVCGGPSFDLHTMSVYLGSTWSPKGVRRNIELFTSVGIGTLPRVLCVVIFYRASMFPLFRLHISASLVSLGTCSTVDKLTVNIILFQRVSRP